MISSISRLFKCWKVKIYIKHVSDCVGSGVLGGGGSAKLPALGASLGGIPPARLTPIHTN